MTGNIVRIDPRRPWHLTPAGIRRIILGETGSGSGQQQGAATGHLVPASKPRRTLSEAASWHLAVVHAERGRLSDHARQAIAAAAILAAASTGVLAIVVGALHEDLAAAGADRVAILSDFDGAEYRPDQELEAVQSLIGTYRPAHIFIPDNADSDGDLGRRLIASGIDGAPHVVELSADHVAMSWSCGAQLARRPLPRVVLLEPGVVDGNLPFTGAAEPVDASDLPAVPVRSDAIRDLGLEAVDAQQISLEEADFIVSAGNGVQNVDTFTAVAEALGAAIGASRVAVDEGRFARDKQVGATGKTVTATTYIAVGISGAVQHLQGIKDCRHVIAINRDAGAPIVKRADLTLIGDGQGIMQALLDGIAEARRADPEQEEAA
jgi:electron transfer flavoprotein alpha subunit